MARGLQTVVSDVNESCPMKVLVASASSNLQQIIRRLVARWGCTAEPVDTAEAAIRAARESRYDAIVTDMHLPDLCGTTMVDRLRQEGVDTPAILLADEETPRLREAAGRLASTRFVAAADPEMLRDALSRARPASLLPPSA